MARAKTSAVVGALDWAGNMVRKSGISDVQPILDGNKAINGFRAKGMFGGAESTIRNMKNHKMGPMQALKSAHTTAEGGMNYGAVAGSYIGVSAAGRVASGGGIHRDRHGRSNMIGVPFI